MAFIVDPKFEIGEIVYLKTDPLQEPYMVLNYVIGAGLMTYALQQGDRQYTYHYDFEISTQKDFNLAS